MSDVSNTTLGLSRVFLRILRVMNIIAAAGFFILLVASFFFEPAFLDHFRKEMSPADVSRILPTLRAMVIVGAPMFALVHVLLTRILEMTETVRIGDPFVPENAARLRVVAWCLLLIEVLHLGFAALAQQIESATVHMDVDFSLTGWLAVLLTFVLARVFEQGAKIRSDLQAMI